MDRLGQQNRIKTSHMISWWYPGTQSGNVGITRIFWALGLVVEVSTMVGVGSSCIGIHKNILGLRVQKCCLQPPKLTYWGDIYLYSWKTSTIKTIVWGRGGYVVASDEIQDPRLIRSKGSIIHKKGKPELQIVCKRVVGVGPRNCG